MATTATGYISQIISTIGTDTLNLSLSTVAANYVDVNMATQLAAETDSTQRTALRTQWIEYYSEGSGATALQQEIDNITHSVLVVQGVLTHVQTAIDQLTTLTTEAAVTATAATAGTTATTATVFTVAANDAWVTAVTTIINSLLTAVMTTVSGDLVSMLQSYKTLGLDIPDSVQTAISTFTTLYTTLNG